jgi:hypothetical protein
MNKSKDKKYIYKIVQHNPESGNFFFEANTFSDPDEAIAALNILVRQHDFMKCYSIAKQREG